MFVLTNDEIDVSGLWSCSLAPDETDLFGTSHGARATRDLSDERDNVLKESSASTEEDDSTKTEVQSDNKYLLIESDSQLELYLSTVFDPGGASGGIYSHGEIFLMFSNSEHFNKDLFSKISLTNFALKVPPQVPGTSADWGLLATQVCLTIKPSSVSNANFYHVLDLSGVPQDSLKCSTTLFCVS